ncbi:hypothetical protein KIW84_064514 [Lathyrus oleraceus]|uniref:GH18 domain-containing protein n=1 Tax=Pisum sativum TaxID=3888 RepID=A0A9D4WE78_PEA|nr:hypothetical protein KIW84_064514 [Pisum sativum]
MEAGDQHYDELARVLNGFRAQKRVYLSAAPQCAFPDAHLDSAITTGLFDYVWVQFYNNFVKACNQLTSSQANQVFLGVPADATKNGDFIPSDVLISQVLPAIKSSVKYDGVMIWKRFNDAQSGHNNASKGGL